MAAAGWKSRRSDSAITPDDLREIESAIAKMTVQGDRYPAELEQQTNRQTRHMINSENLAKAA